MSDDSRLESLKVEESEMKYNNAIKIKKIIFKNYKFFNEEFELQIDSENLLLYGENGSGKSTIYKALELLTQKEFKNFDENRNIFSEDGDVEVEFSFSNDKNLIISADLEEIPDHVDFIKNLSVFKPMLDYKKLLLVHHSTNITDNTTSAKINIHAMIRQLLKDFPVEIDGKKKNLYELTDFNVYFKKLKDIIEKDFFKDINIFLIKYFKSDFKIDKFEFTTKIDQEKDSFSSPTATPIVNIIIDYKNHVIEKYHTFLNEARLSALAISIYFVSIKKLLEETKGENIKILVLDDLLISLDMNNRIKLLEILKNEFSDFQIFFFTHDKELFEMYKDKMNWKKYELYLDDSGEIPKAIMKINNSDLERAKMFYAKKEYDISAFLLRKEFDKLLKNFLPYKEKIDKNGYPLDLSGLIDKATSKADGDIKSLLEKLDSDRRHILNPLSHRNDVKIYSEEIKSAIDDLVELKRVLK